MGGEKRKGRRGDLVGEGVDKLSVTSELFSVSLFSCFLLSLTERNSLGDVTVMRGRKEIK